MDSLFFLTINLILQSYVDCYSLKKCLKKENEAQANIRVVEFIVFFIANVLLITQLRNMPNIILIVHLGTLFTLGCIYKNSIRDFIAIYSLGYYFHLAYTLIFSKAVSIYTRKDITYQLLFLYIIVLILYYAILIKFKYIYISISKNRKYSLTVIVTSLLIDFPIMFYMNLLYDEPSNVIKTTVILFVTFILTIVAYFYKIYTKSELINDLNKELELRNTELKNIKNTNTNIIFYLEQLYSSGSKDEGGILLKKIINKEINESEIIKNNMENTSLIQTAVNKAISKGIDVIVDEQCDIFCANMNGIELYRIIVNILNNAIKALNNKGKICVKTYYYDDNNICLTIGNNGPKIEDKVIKKIFQAGFTTKNNEEKNHGYGLNIVKELIENNNGEISVNSTEEWTEFKIILPRKEAKP